MILCYVGLFGGINHYISLSLCSWVFRLFALWAYWEGGGRIAWLCGSKERRIVGACSRVTRGFQSAIFLSMFFTGFFENVHPPAIVHTVATTPLRGHLVPARHVEGVPREQPVVAIRGVRVVDVFLQFALVEVRHLAVVARGLGSVWRVRSVILNIVQ